MSAGMVVRIGRVFSPGTLQTNLDTTGHSRHELHAGLKIIQARMTAGLKFEDSTTTQAWLTDVEINSMAQLCGASNISPTVLKAGLDPLIAADLKNGNTPWEQRKNIFEGLAQHSDGATLLEDVFNTIQTMTGTQLAHIFVYDQHSGTPTASPTAPVQAPVAQAVGQPTATLWTQPTTSGLKTIVVELMGERTTIEEGSFAVLLNGALTAFFTQEDRVYLQPGHATVTLGGRAMRPGLNLIKGGEDIAVGSGHANIALHRTTSPAFAAHFKPLLHKLSYATVDELIAALKAGKQIPKTLDRDLMTIVLDLASADYLKARTTLLQGIHRGFAASLPTNPTPIGQIMTDIHRLMNTGFLSDGSSPLAIYLENLRSLYNQ